MSRFALGILLIWLQLAPRPAAAQDHVVETFEHIVLSQNLTISAHHLCHDGLFVYFKDQQSCLDSGDHFSCDEGLRIVPIRSVEKVYQSVGGPSITRFFKVKTSYRYQMTQLLEDGDAQVLQDEIRSLPLCPNQEIFEPGNVGSVQYVETPDEEAIFWSLYRRGYRYLNTPYGNLRDMEILRDEPKEEISEVETPFRSPQCNPLIPSSLLTLLSGEHTGNGVQAFQIDFMQAISRPVFLERRQARGEEHQQAEADLKFSCNQTQEI